MNDKNIVVASVAKQSLGFVQTGTKKFERLPFLICFMEKAVSAEQVE